MIHRLQATLLVVLMVGCTSGSETASRQSAPPDPPAPVESSGELSPTMFLGSLEAIAVETNARNLKGQLAGEWTAAWSEIELARQNDNVAALVNALHTSGSSADVLGAGSTTIDTYIRSFDLALKLLDAEASNNTLDEGWAPIYAQARFAIDQPGQTESSSSAERNRDFCCVVHLNPPADPTAPQPLLCFQWHTFGLWAGAHCAAKGIGLNRSGSTLYGGICQDHPDECPL